MKLTKELLVSEDYFTTRKAHQAIYILEDGTLWSGEFDCGLRGIDHRSVETFTEYDRYDGSKFWKEVFNKLNLVMVIPEYQEMLYTEKGLTEAQVKQMKVLEEMGWESKLFI